MKLIIDIPEEEVNECKRQVDMIKQEGFLIESLNTALKIHVANGTPLPKGHGRILDEKDILDTKNNDGGWYDLVDMPEYIAGVKAIIEADKAESENKCKGCEYYLNPDYTRCHECKAERSDKE